MFSVNLHHNNKKNIMPRYQETNPELENLIAQSLASGLSQSEISELFKTQGIKPNSLSTIEKYIKQMKEDYKANTLFHLAVILRKKGII